MRNHPVHRSGGLPAAALLCCLVPSSPVMADPEATPTAGEQAVTLVRTPPEILTRQGLPNFVGISAETAGARGLSMNLVVIPPGAAAEPHFHKGFESAVYVLEGRVETRYGPGLEASVITEAGDFLFIPPDVPHQPVNLSETETARAVVVRNDPREQEHVILYDPNAHE
jgi:uncharacterized RmlC-like cupin family protein